MKTNKILLTAFSVLFSLSALAQEVDPKKVEEKIASAGEKIELLVVEEDSPLLKDPEEELCANDAVPKVFEPNTNLWNTVKHLVKDTGGILVAPVGWKKEDWLKASAVVAGILLITTQDKMIKDFSQSIKNPTTEFLSAGLEKLGNGGTVLPALGIGYAASVLFKDKKLQNVTLTALESATIAAVLTTLGKHIFHRTRPYRTDNPYEFDPGNFKSGNVSFPSGHTGTAFAIATVFAEAYKDKKIIPILAYSAATLAGLSRIHDNKHWASDVALGAVLGYAAGKFVSNRRLNSTGITITPSFSFGPTGGMSVSAIIPIGNKKKKK